MLTLMGCAIFAEYFQPGVIMQAPSSFFARTDRTYRESPANFLGQLLITLFRQGMVAMMLFLCVCPANNASFTAFCAIFGSMIGVVLLKMLINVFIDYIFQLSRRFGAVYEPYGDLVTMISLLLFPAVLVLIRYGNPIASKWVAGGMVVLFVALWFFRAWRTYVSSLITLVYILLYTATMEILPLAGLIYLSGKIITNI